MHQAYIILESWNLELDDLLFSSAGRVRRGAAKYLSRTAWTDYVSMGINMSSTQARTSVSPLRDCRIASDDVKFGLMCIDPARLSSCTNGYFTVRYVAVLLSTYVLKYFPNVPIAVYYVHLTSTSASPYLISYHIPHRCGTNYTSVRIIVKSDLGLGAVIRHGLVLVYALPASKPAAKPAST